MSWSYLSNITSFLENTNFLSLCVPQVSAYQMKFKTLNTNSWRLQAAEAQLSNYVWYSYYDIAYSVSHILLYHIAVIDMYSYFHECKFVIMCNKVKISHFQIPHSIEYQNIFYQNASNILSIWYCQKFNPFSLHQTILIRILHSEYRWKYYWYKKGEKIAYCSIVKGIQLIVTKLFCSFCSEIH